MHRPALLPRLPGYNFDENIGRTKFHKSQHFGRIHEGVYYLTDKLERKRDDRYPSMYARGEQQEVPPWIAYDGQRLSFKAFFQETVQERWKSSFQIRLVNISYFLEDGTIKITEPSVDNSGLEQGVLLRRQRVPTPNPFGREYYDILDLNIGKEPEIYGRVYKIVDCDRFTRGFLHRMGIPVPDPLQIPNDPYVEARKVETFAKKPSRKVDTLGKFLKYDRQVLRFYGYWDDTDSPHGYVHDLEIHYFLADNTIEIKEILPDNCGRDTTPMLLRRTRVPKFYSGLEPIGASEPFTILNVLGGDEAARTYSMIDSLDPNGHKGDYYREEELGIGIHLNVFGRRLVITDMDPFTKQYYREKYGIEVFDPVERPRNRKEREEGYKVERYIPPYNGFGSYEDSLGNCFTVMPKPPRTDFTKFLRHDKHGFDGHVLRFRAKMLSNVPANNDRHFIIRVHLMDDTISVFELAIRNSGFERRAFQKRMRVALPGEKIFTNKPTKYYEPQDFYVGARLNLNEFHFQLTSADVYALRYMELHPDKFPKANIKLIMEKIREALRPVYKEFVANNEPSTGSDSDAKVIEYRRLREALCKYLGEKITEHEIITVARHYSSHGKKELRTREYVRRLMHSELNRSSWDELERLEEDLRHWERSGCGYLPRETVYAVLRGCRLPVDVELLNSMLEHLKKDEEGKIDCADLLRFMNSKIEPVEPLPPINAKTALWWASEKEPDCGAGINWCLFLEGLAIEQEKREGEDGDGEKEGKPPRAVPTVSSSN